MVFHSFKNMAQASRFSSIHNLTFHVYVPFSSFMNSLFHQFYSPNLCFSVSTLLFHKYMPFAFNLHLLISIIPLFPISSMKFSWLKAGKALHLMNFYKEFLSLTQWHCFAARHCCCLVIKLCLTLVTPWTVACQAPLSMAFPRQEYWCGLPFPSPVDLPNPGIKPASPALVGRCFTIEPPGKPIIFQLMSQLFFRPCFLFLLVRLLSCDLMDL